MWRNLARKCGNCSVVFEPKRSNVWGSQKAKHSRAGTYDRLENRNGRQSHGNNIAIRCRTIVCSASSPTEAHLATSSWLRALRLEAAYQTVCR